jgi:hypothetical protein
MENIIKDKCQYKGIITCQKYREGDPEPYEVLNSENIWLTTGWTELLKIITGQSDSVFNATNALIGVGTSATTATAIQTDLIGTSTKYKGMESGYPTVPTSGTVLFKSKFLTSEANFAHNELVVKNNDSGVCWNRDATGWGTKDSTEIWYYTVCFGVA